MTAYHDLERAQHHAQTRADFTGQAHYVYQDGGGPFTVVSSALWQWRPLRTICWIAWPVNREVDRD